MSNPLPTGFQPAFKRVQQANDFDDAFACIAMLANKTLIDVRQIAIEKLKHPKHGPFWIGEHLIQSLLAHFNLVGTVYKTHAEPLPDVALLLVEYDETTEIGRHVLFHRTKIEDAKKQATVVEYVVDPAYWIDAPKHVRSDWQALKPAWYIGVTPMKTSGPAAGSK